jgi:NAD(P)-dependent dehydrogenase (short-subunit alcohol dehydrogenase family)
MKIDSCVALVTGANRGLERHFAEQLLARGASRVYAAARDERAVTTPGAVSLRLDVTDPESIARAADLAGDVNLLVNNAGISTHTPLIDSDLSAVDRELQMNFWGPLRMTRAFAPALSRHGGAVVNVPPLPSWEHRPDYGAYSASKAASWAMSNVTRQELAPTASP